MFEILGKFVKNVRIKFNSLFFKDKDFKISRANCVEGNSGNGFSVPELKEYLICTFSI